MSASTASKDTVYGQKGKLLTLGDGDFTYTLSLLRYVDNPTNIFATCLETEKTIHKHKNADDVIQTLTSKGVTVLYNVDATRLVDCAELKGHKFAYIIFNFPHIGGKASVGQNRKLLRGIFESCVEYLHDDGEIHISLCGGQGGTPADVPQRLWPNSWQVVGMATYADLILTRTLPFDPSMYPEYACTGFRSQDKPFFQKGGIVHIFKKSLPIPLNPAPSKTFEAVVMDTKMSFQYPPSLVGFIERDLFTEDLHPIQIVKDATLQILGEMYADTLCVVGPKQLNMVVIDTDDSRAYKLLSTEDVSENDETVTNVGEALQSNVSENDETVTNVRDALQDNVSENDETVTNVSEALEDVLTLTDEVSKSRSCRLNKHGRKNSHVYSLQPNLLVHVNDILSANNSLNLLLWGQTFSHCCIKPGNFPIKHEVLCVFRNQTDSVKDTCVSILKNLLGDVETVEFDEVCKTEASQESWQLTDGNYIGSHCIKVGVRGMSRVVGSIGTCHVHNSEAAFINLHLDSLAMLAFNFSDVRHIWSQDGRLWDRFKGQVSKSLQNSGDVCRLLNGGITLEPYSIYPPVHTHDISLWENPDLPRLLESDFFAILREVCHHQVVDVNLKDQYVHPTTGSKSRCYRMVYVSPDRALSKDMAAQQQIQFRQALRDRMGVYLR